LPVPARQGRSSCHPCAFQTRRRAITHRSPGDGHIVAARRVMRWHRTDLAGLSDMTTSSAAVARAPWYVPLFSPLAILLLKLGVPLGLNGLITIRGRKSGQPRTTPVAIIDVDGRRWIWAPWGEV